MSNTTKVLSYDGLSYYDGKIKQYVQDYVAENAPADLTEEDPTVPSWAKSPTKPSYTASEVGADPSGSASSALQEAKTYVNNAVAQKSQVQITTWEADD